MVANINSIWYNEKVYELCKGEEDMPIEEIRINGFTKAIVYRGGG